MSHQTIRSPYRRVLLKLSGESLMGDQKFGIDSATCDRMALEIQELSQFGVQVGIVIGGGNLFRGARANDTGMKRTPADQIGMLATLMNGIALQQAFEKIGAECRVLSAISSDSIVESYSWKRALHYLDQGVFVVFVGGTGNPYFTTDSAAALRALEMGAEILFKATKVDGIYDKDPFKYPDAVRFDRLTYSEVLARGLEVMDPAAIALCRENKMPIAVFNLFEKGALKRAICGESVGTIVEER